MARVDLTPATGIEVGFLQKKRRHGDTGWLKLLKLAAVVVGSVIVLVQAVNSFGLIELKKGWVSREEWDDLMMRVDKLEIKIDNLPKNIVEEMKKNN